LWRLIDHFSLGYFGVYIRVLSTLLLLQTGYHHAPYSSLERIIEENKDGYYRALRLSQKQICTAGENLDDWVRFFLQSLKKQKDLLLGKAEQEKLLERLPPTSEQLFALAKERGRLTIMEAVTLLGINRNTITLHLRQLVHQRHLEQHGSGKATWYSLT
jgi:Fic family protein